MKSVITSCKTLDLIWDDASESKFAYIWLRDNCYCSQCGSHASGSRFQSFLDIPDDVRPARLDIKEGTLGIVWENDGHESNYKFDWLKKNCPSTRARLKNRHNIEGRVFWNSNLSQLPIVDYQLVVRDISELHKIFLSVSKYGFTIVENVGIDSDETEKLANLLGYIRDTHFGRIGDLVLRPSGSHISDYPKAILPHTDETYRSTPIDINIFHCIHPSEDGGGITTLVDSHYCASALRRDHPNEFNILTQAPIQHERVTDRELIRSNQPAIKLDSDGNISEVRLNERTMSAIAVDENDVESVYRALRIFFSIAYDRRNWISYGLRKGEALVFDNMRLLHGRTEFKSYRRIRQTNVMRDEFLARKAYLDEVVSQKSLKL